MSHSGAFLRDGALIDGQFRLEQLLGEGGMGTVWAAQDLKLQRQVAVKLLSRELFSDAQARARFEREAQLIARINSPHVVQVFAQGRTEFDVPFLVMELLHGEDLAAKIEREGRCSLNDAAPIVAQICRGLSRAHQQGLVHRDVKPGNIFLAHGDRDETGQDDREGVLVKLLDFGIAKDLNLQLGNITLQGEVIGSLKYISPEQLRDPQSVDETSDIWAVGVVIYEMLTGRLPFEVQSLSELCDQYRDGSFPTASSLVPDLPPELDELLSWVIHVDHKQRFQNVEELGEAFACVVRTHALKAPSHSRKGAALEDSTRISNDRTISSSAVRLSSQGGAMRRFALVAMGALLAAALLGLVYTRRARPARVRFMSAATVAPLVVEAPAAPGGSVPEQPVASDSAAPLASPPIPVGVELPKLAPKAREGQRRRYANPAPEHQARIAAEPVTSEPAVSTDRSRSSKPETRNHGF